MKCMFTVLLLAVLSLPLCSWSQSYPAPTVGQRYPNPARVDVKTVEGKKTLSLQQWRGKPLIVDFFSSYCTVCFKMMPKLKQLQQVFGAELDFLLIGKEDAQVRKVYQRFEKELGLSFQVAFDSVLTRDLYSFSFPLYVWIDGQGIVQGVTGVEEMTREKVEQFLKTGKITTKESIEQIPFDPNKPFLVEGNGGADMDFLSRTLISRWNPTQPLFLPDKIDWSLPKKELQLIGVSLCGLYNYAFFGKERWGSRDSLYGQVFPFPVLPDGSWISPENFQPLYCYSIWTTHASASPTSLQDQMIRDLVFQFGYEASIEYRLLPYNKITVRDSCLPLIQSKKDTKKVSVNLGGWELQRVPLSLVVDLLDSRFPFECPFVDETGLDQPIDLTVEAMMTDFTLVKKRLFEKGFLIEQSVRPMRAIVLTKKDPGCRH